MPTIFYQKSIIFIMFLIFCIDMGGDFGLRNVIIPICMIFIFSTFGCRVPKNFTLQFSILIFWPLISLGVGVISGVDVALALSQYQSTFLAFILYIVIYQIPHEMAIKFFIYSLFATAATTVFLAIGLIFDLNAITNVLQTMAEMGGGYFGARGVEDDELVPNIYFKSTLFFTSAFVFALYIGKFRIAILFLVALMAAISKVGVIVSVLSLIIHSFRKQFRRYIFYYLIIIIVIIFLIWNSPLIVLFSDLQTADSATVSARTGHFESLVFIWSENPMSFIFGFGLGTEFYSIGAGRVVSNIEIDHFNLIRKYGLLWSLIFFYSVLQTAYWSIKNSNLKVRAMGWSLLVGFCVAGTNPVLLSPVFFLLLFITMIANDQTRKMVKII